MGNKWTELRFQSGSQAEVLAFIDLTGFVFNLAKANFHVFHGKKHKIGTSKTKPKQEAETSRSKAQFAQQADLCIVPDPGKRRNL
ncbi:hypothetical protein [uncultured Allobaculum sp.]|uniref:hypothetical protein n=1 Tax=uncultured Allobaculum sp. TaxID=1187017 RepID=UPI0025940835|nr:hypothetical protein [uncultured Allobaculum sp.]